MWMGIPPARQNLCRRAVSQTVITQRCNSRWGYLQRYFIVTGYKWHSTNHSVMCSNHHQSLDKEDVTNQGPPPHAQRQHLPTADLGPHAGSAASDKGLQYHALPMAAGRAMNQISQHWWGSASCRHCW